MNIILPLAIVCLLGLTLAAEEPEKKNYEDAGAPQSWKLRQGDICSLKRHPLPSYKPDEFFECLKPTNDEANWPWAEIGIWMIRKCQPGREFSITDRTCRRLETVRKLQQTMCQANPQTCNRGVMPTIQQPIYPQPSIQTGGCNSVSGCPRPQPCVNQPCQVVQPVFTPRPYVQPQPIYTQPPYVPQPVYTPRPYVQPQPVYPQPVYPQPQPSPYSPCGQPMPNQPIQNNCQPQVVTMPCDKAGSGGVGGQGFCSWMIDPLRAGTSPKQYMVCAPASASDPYCGRWQPMPCPCGSIFNANLQVCTRDAAASQACPQESGCPQAVPGQPFVAPTGCPQQPLPAVRPSCGAGTTPIAGCNAKQQCPGYSSCNKGTCCQPNYG